MTQSRFSSDKIPMAATLATEKQNTPDNEAATTCCSWSHFAEQTSIHGVKYIVNGSGVRR